MQGDKDERTDLVRMLFLPLGPSPYEQSLLPAHTMNELLAYDPCNTKTELFETVCQTSLFSNTWFRPIVLLRGCELFLHSISIVV